MAKDQNNRALAFSQKIYGRLLLAYPPAHRAEYGPAMAQLFRDQCRDAWNESQGWGVARLWLRVLPDLVNTSIMERLAALNERKSMSDKLTPLIQPRTAFLKSFVLVFLLTVCATVTITFLLPESYASTARIKIEKTNNESSEFNNAGDGSTGFDPFFIQTEFEIIQDQAVLGNVIASLNLNEVWGKKYNGGEALKTSETMEFLKRRMSLTPVRNTMLIEITVYSEDRNEAAKIANALAHAYQDYRAKSQAELMTKGIGALQQDYQRQEAQISQVQSDLDALRKTFNVLDNDPAASSAELQQRYEKMRDENEQVYRRQLAELTNLQKLSKDQLRDVLPTVEPDSTLSELLSQFNLAEQQFARLKNDYSPTHPDYIRQQSLVDTLNTQIKTRISGIMGGLETTVAVRRAALDSLAAKVETVKTAQPYWDKKRDLALLLEFHRLLATKIEAERLGAQFPKFIAAEIIRRAEPGQFPVRPNKPLNIVLGVVIGILLGLAIGAGMSGISALIRRKSGGGGTTPGTGAPSSDVPGSVGSSHAKTGMNKVIGLLWMGISGTFSGLWLIVLFRSFGDVLRIPVSLFIPLLGIFWAGNVVAGFFLYRGKPWARICIGAEAILLVIYFLLINAPFVPHLLRFVPIVFWSITAFALFWPRKQTAASLR